MPIKVHSLLIFLRNPICLETSATHSHVVIVVDGASTSVPLVTAWGRTSVAGTIIPSVARTVVPLVPSITGTVLLSAIVVMGGAVYCTAIPRGCATSRHVATVWRVSTAVATAATHAIISSSVTHVAVSHVSSSAAFLGAVCLDVTLLLANETPSFASFHLP